MATQLFKCSICKEKLPFTSFYPKTPQGRDTREVTYECKSCRKLRDRSTEKWSRALKRSGGVVCPTCEWPRKLADGEQCAECLATQGWRVCLHCHQRKLLLLDFAGDPRCYDCHIEMLPEHADAIKALRERRAKTAEAQAAVAHAPAEHRRRAMAIWHSFRMDWFDYAALIEEQEGLCAICRDEFGGTPHVDHDHATGQVRGLLCLNCNHGLGKFADSPGRLIAAAEYLKKKGPTVVAVSPLG